MLMMRSLSTASSSFSCSPCNRSRDGIINRSKNSIFSCRSSPSTIHLHGQLKSPATDRRPLRLWADDPLPATARRKAHSLQATSSSVGGARGGDVDAPGDDVDRFNDTDNSRPTSATSTSLNVNGAASANTGNTRSNLSNMVYLGVLLGLWYLFNIYFNIYNKQVLEVFPFPLTISTLQFAMGTLLILIMWTTNLYKLPKISTSQLLAILPLAIMHASGNLFLNMSLGKVAVSFTHTIKAMEPFFSVILSALFLGENPTIWTLSSLVPVVGGVVLASMTEVSFNWTGFWSAMASNLTNQSRNVLSKKIMVKKEESLDNITLFSVMTIMSFILSVPIALFVEGIRFTPSYIQAAGLNMREVYMRSLLASLCFHAYQQVGYMVLARVSPVSHSVANCVKRVVVIVSSVLFFRTPVSPINSLGTGFALAGAFLYSRANKIKQKTS